jgi:phosphatidylglycerophosphate synthase
MLERPAVARPPESRAFVDQALADLRSCRWRPRAWRAFLWRCTVRSAQQARRHPRAALQVTTLHLVLLPLARRSVWRLTASWALAITHLGLLGPEAHSIGPANALSLLRANLPTRRWAPAVAIATDAADGWLARRTRPTAFGEYADPLADVAFWTRYAWARDRRPVLRAAVAALWLLPVPLIVGAYFAAGRTVDYPRPLLARRLSACLQLLLAARACAGLSDRGPRGLKE